MIVVRSRGSPTGVLDEEVELSMVGPPQGIGALGTVEGHDFVTVPEAGQPIERERALPGSSACTLHKDHQFRCVTQT